MIYYDISSRNLIPSCHWEIVIGSLGKEHLIHIDVSDIEGSSAAAEVKIPHTDEFAAHLGFHLSACLLEVMVPAGKRLVIMAAKALHVQKLELPL